MNPVSTPGRDGKDFFELSHSKRPVLPFGQSKLTLASVSTSDVAFGVNTLRGPFRLSAGYAPLCFATLQGPG